MAIPTFTKLPDTTESEIQSVIARLPKGYREALDSFDWRGQIIKIGQRYSLALKQLEKFVIETTLVVIGLAEGDDYLNELVRRVEVTPQRALSLREDVENEIFNPLEESLKIHLRDPDDKFDLFQQNNSGESYNAPTTSAESFDESPTIIELEETPREVQSAIFVHPETVGKKIEGITPRNKQHDPYHEPLE